MKARSSVIFTLVWGVLMVSFVNACTNPEPKVPGYDCRCEISPRNLEDGGWTLFCFANSSQATTTSPDTSTVPTTTLKPVDNSTDESVNSVTDRPLPPTTTRPLPPTTTQPIRDVQESTLVPEQDTAEDTTIPTIIKDPVENIVDKSGDKSSQTKREERVSSTKLKDGVTEMPHLVRMPLRSASQARPRRNVYARNVVVGKRQDFSISYSKRNLEITCDTGSVTVRRLLSHLGVHGIKTLTFRLCPLLPNNLTIQQLLGPNEDNLIGLSFISPKTSGTLTSHLFEGIAKNITVLHIDQNSENKSWSLRGFEAGFFDNFASLTDLRLTFIPMETIPPNFFNKLNKLVTLSLNSNNIRAVKRSDFKGLESLTTLYINQNNISEIGNESFGDLKNLMALDLTSNPVVRWFPQTLFTNLTKLKSLSLQGIGVNSLPGKVFRFNGQLKRLFLDSNNFTNGLPEDLLEGLISLEELSLSNNNLPQVKAKLFKSTVNLKSLDLHNNRITLIPEGLFYGTDHLKKLVMSSNDLEEIPLHAFTRLDGLEELNLEGNNVRFLRNGVFGNLNSLKVINLERNDIEKIDQDVFEPLAGLLKLNLKENKLTKFVKLQFNLKLTDIDLGSNFLTEIPTFEWSLLKNLSNISFENNHIEELWVPNLFSFKTTINLRGNQIKHISPGYYRSTKEGTEHTYLLDGNSFNCDCNLLPFYKYLRTQSSYVDKFEDPTGYTCDGLTEARKPRFLVERAASDFTCPITECPERCTCFFRSSDNTTHVDCSSKNLDTLPTMPMNITDLVFDHNNITSLTNNVNGNVPVIYKYPALERINFDNNLIDDISGLLVNPPAKLKQASLKNNKIKNIATVGLTNISFNVSLSGNPFQCDCSTIHMRNFIRRNAAHIQDYRYLECDHPFPANDTLVRTMNEVPDDLYCPPDLTGAKIIIGVCVAIAFIVVILVIAYYRNQHFIKVYMFVHHYKIFFWCFGDADPEEKKLYDAFLSYSTTYDSDVRDALLKELEVLLGDTGELFAKLCIHDRDWRAGLNISTNIVSSVQNSRRTILVVSKDYIQSVWFNVELKWAITDMMRDNLKNVIVIVKGDLPPEETLDEDLRALLKTKTYLKWGDRYFWDSIKYALHKPTQVPALNKTKGMLNKQIPMNVIMNRNNVPQKDIENVDKIIENEMNKKNLENARKHGVDPDEERPKAVTVPTIFSKPMGDGSYGKFQGGHVNQGFEPVSTEDISVRCDSLREEPNNVNPLSARHRPHGVTRPPRRRVKESSSEA